MIGTPPITQINHPAEGVYGRPVGAGDGPGLLLSAAELRAIASVYSSAQVDTLLLGKSDTGHGHSVGDISGLGTLATQNGTFSGVSSGTNTGDQDLSSYLTSPEAASTYLPLTGGTLTGPITGTSGLIEQRNGLTAQCLEIFETYTSGTNNGKLRLKATSSGHQIGSARAASGSNRAVQIGHFDASDVFTAGVTIGTTGALGLGGTPSTLAALHSQSTVTRQFLFNRSEIGTGTTDGTYFSCGSGGEFTILNQENSTLRIGTNNAIVMTLSGSATLFAGQVTQVPPSSVTLGTNGYFSIEMTSNTAGNLVYRGSDGTTRRMALLFA